MNASLTEQIAPEIVQAITREAAARGLSINDYLRDLLGLGLNSCFILASLEYNLIRPGLCARAKRDLQSLDARGERRWLHAE